MKKWSISEKVIKEFWKTKVISKRRMNELSGNTRCITGVIQSLRKRGYKIEVERADDDLTILKYTLISYKKPFYLIARDIERNHPKLQKYIRFLYSVI